jgi:hypothetical protein
MVNRVRSVRTLLVLVVVLMSLSATFASATVVTSGGCCNYYAGCGWVAETCNSSGECVWPGSECCIGVCY